MRVVNYDSEFLIFFDKGFFGSLDVGFVVVGVFGVIFENDEVVFVFVGMSDGSKILFGYIYEVMFGSSSIDGIDSNIKIVIGFVFEVDGEG